VPDDFRPNASRNPFVYRFLSQISANVSTAVVRCERRTKSPESLRPRDHCSTSSNRSGSRTPAFGHAIPTAVTKLEKSSRVMLFTRVPPKWPAFLVKNSACAGLTHRVKAVM